MRICRMVLLGLSAAIALTAARPLAEEYVAAGVPDLTGARGLALSAYRGLAGGNDGIYSNAAALAARKRYAIEGQWLLDRLGGAAAFQAFGASVVDSETSAVAGGFAYARAPSGPWQGNLLHTAFAFPFGASFFLGATAKYFTLDGPSGQHVGAVNADASAFWQASSIFSLGVSGYNLLRTGHRGAVFPRGLGAGVAIGDDRRFHITGDWRGDFDRGPGGKTTSLYAVGGELLVTDAVPLRAGYLRDETRHASYWSAGTGFVATSGLGVDVSYRQGLDRTDDRTFAVALKLFVFQQ